MLNYITKIRDEDGQALVEYALIITLIALVCVAGLSLAGNAINDMLSSIPFG